MVQEIMKTAVVSAMLAALLPLAVSCGGGGGGSISQTVSRYGGLDGYVYESAVSAARAADAVPAGYKAVSGAQVSAKCGNTTKSTTTDAEGKFTIGAVPVGTCTVDISKSGLVTRSVTVTVESNKTTTVGGSSGTTMTTSVVTYIPAKTPGGN